MKRTVFIGLLTGAMTYVASLGAVASADGPQPLPEGACNQGTAIGYVGYNVVPHWKDWDHDGEYACYHLNPTYPPGEGSGLE
jgi:hypothetical protein